VRRIIVTVIRMVVGFGLAAYLLHLTLRRTGADLVAELAAATHGLLLAAGCLHGGVIAIGIWRWHLLLRTQGIAIAVSDTGRLNLIGMFFNLLVPGAVGGDLFKMGFLARQTPGKRTEAVFSILVDRLFGMFGLFVVAGVAVLAARHEVARLGPGYRAAAWIIGGGSLTGILAALALEFHRPILEHPWLRPLWAVAARHAPHRLAETVRRLVAGLDSYRRARATLALVLLISIVVHTAMAAEAILIGKALHESTLTVRQYFVTTQIANAFAAVPLAPGGVGQRDRGAQAFFEAFGMEHAKSGAIPLTLTLVFVFWGLVGAAVLVFSPSLRSLGGRSAPPGGAGPEGRPTS